MAQCAKCGNTVRAGARFCGSCGVSLAPIALVGASQITGTVLPYIQIEPALALSGPPLTSTSASGEQAIFGFRFDTLPDWLSAPEVMGQNEVDKLAWALRNWQQFVANFWKWKGVALALRFLSWPDQGAIEAALLARVRLPTQAQQVAAALAADLQAQLAALRLEPLPLTTAAALAAARRPASLACLLEVRQHERLVRLNLGDAYLVYPLPAPTGDFRLVFETLLRTSQPTLLSLYLEPTELMSTEHDSLAQAASIAGSLADFQYSGQHYQGRWQDPQAALVGQVYTEFIRRLGQPFICAAHVAGANPPDAWAVARALASALAVEPPPSPAASARPASVQSDVIQANDPLQRQALSAALTDLTLSRWGQSQATPGKERLPYLADAAGAAALVRFPIAGRGGAPGLRVKQVAPGYDQGVKRPQAAGDEISLGAFLSDGVATVKVGDLTRHGLIAGFTGSGKTNTCLHLLDQLWRQHHIPVLIIEPAKSEYRGLMGRSGFEELRVFTLGDEATSPFRLNPFELLPGIRLEAHLSALKTCFNAAMPQFGVLPTIIEEALIRVYRDKGWELTDQPRPPDERLFPTIGDMYTMVIRVTEERGYSGEVHDNIRAAAAGRIGSLLAGSKGRMFNCQRSIPISLLLSGPVVLELDTLNDNEKALAMMFLLAHLREHCKLNRPDSHLAHLTLIEEAHRVLENVQSVAGSEVTADTRAEAVRFFAGLLAEIRAYGEGILIAEQSPSKLAPDAIRNTNLKIAHMLLDSRDREAMAGAMIMDEEQKLFMGKLPVGQAALFMTGYEKATFIRVPPIKGSGYAERLPDREVERCMQPFRQAYAAAYLPFDGCRFCGSPCRYRQTIEPVTADKALAITFDQALLTFTQRSDPTFDAQNWLDVAQACAQAAARSGHPSVVDAAYCYLTHRLDFPFTPHMRRQFATAFGRL